MRDLVLSPYGNLNNNGIGLVGIIHFVDKYSFM